MKRFIVWFMMVLPLISQGQTVLFGTETSWDASTGILGTFSRNTSGNTWQRFASSPINARLTQFTTNTTFLETTNNINTTGYTNVEVRFKEWITGSFPKAQVRLMFSTNGGTNWINTGFSSNATTSIPSNTNVSVSLGAASNISNLKVRFSCTGANYSGTGTYNIDDFVVYGSAIPTTYYNKPGEDVSLLSTWGTQTDGSGGSPINFYDDNQTFNIYNGTSETMASDWIVEGNGSKIVVGDGINPITFTIPADFTLSVQQLNLSAQSTFINASSAQLPAFGTIASNSTFVYQYDTDISIVPATYYNLKLEGLGNKLFDGASSYIVSNTLDVNSQFGNVSLFSGSLTLQGNITGTPVFSGTIESQLIVNKTGGGIVGTLSFDPLSTINSLQITNGEVTLASDVSFDGLTSPTLSIGSAGTLDAASFIVKGSNSTGGVATIQGTLKSSNLQGLFGGSNTTFDQNFTTPNFSSGTIELNASTGNQGVPTLTGGNKYLHLSLSGGATKSFENSVYNITGNFSQTGGAISLGSGTTFLYDGTGSQSLPALNYTTVTFGGSGNKSLGTSDSTRVTVGMVVNGSAVVVTGGRLVLKATSASQTAYLLDNTSGNGVSGNVTVERIVPNGRPGTPTVSGLPILVSSPVAGSLSTIQSTNTNFFSYVATNTTGSRFTRVTVSNSITPGQGYLLRKFGGFVFRYVGSINSGNITQNLIFGGDNFNLIGNPYPSAITWDATNLTLNNLASSNQYKVYDGSAYVVRNVGTTIPMGQGIFVEAAAAGASVTFRNQSRQATSGTMARTINPNENRMEIWINRNSTQKDMIVLWGQNDADSKTYLNRNDGKKFMPTNAAYPAVFATKPSVNLDVFTYGLQESAVIIPLTVRIPKDTTYTLQFIGINNVDASAGIILVDSILNTSQNMRVNDTYTFQATTSTGKRFRVLISQVVTSEESSSVVENSQVWVSSNQKIVSIFTPENAESIRIYDLAGNTVYSQPSQSVQTDVNLQQQPEGIYIAGIQTNGKLIYKKFVLSN